MQNILGLDVLGTAKSKPHLLKFPLATKIPSNLECGATLNTRSLFDNAWPPFNQIVGLLPEGMICPGFIQEKN